MFRYKLGLQRPHDVAVLVGNQVLHSRTQTYNGHVKVMLNAVHLLPWPTRCITAWSNGKALAGHGACNTSPPTGLLVCNICMSMLCVFFGTSSDGFWNFRPSWTGTARSHGRKTGGKGHCRLLFWKLLSFWICWPGQPELWDRHWSTHCPCR